MTNDDELVLRLALDLLDARTGRGDGALAVPELPLDRFTRAGFRTGLTAAVGAWAEAAGVALPAGWAPWLADQRAEVAARHERFAVARGRALVALTAAGIDAVPVKGAVLTADPAAGWPDATARPMADLDLVIAPADRRLAGAALTSAGFPLLHRSAWEDTHLAWAGSEPLRLDGESAGHPGKLELHPGWVERLHDYLVDDGGLVLRRADAGTLAGAPCRRLDPVGFAAHVTGHLAACVVRADARALHVVDVVAVLGALDEDGRDALVDLWERLDPRLSAPALWLVAAHRPALVDGDVVERGLARLGPAARRQLRAVPPGAVLRGGRARTTWAWRHAFARSLGERVHVARQLVAPAATDAPDRGRLGLRHARRAVRAAARRTTGRP